LDCRTPKAIWIISVIFAKFEYYFGEQRTPITGIVRMDLIAYGRPDLIKYRLKHGQGFRIGRGHARRRRAALGDESVGGSSDPAERRRSPTARKTLRMI
jgi:hypothetical protein